MGLEGRLNTVLFDFLIIIWLFTDRSASMQQELLCSEYPLQEARRADKNSYIELVNVVSVSCAYKCVC